MSSWTETPEHFGSDIRKTVLPAASQDQLEMTVRLSALAHLLSIIHAATRRSGKGESVRWYRDDLPSTVPDIELDELISIYDRRHLSREGIHAGTDPFRFYPFFTEVPRTERLDQFALVVNELPEVTDVPYWRGPVAAVEGSAMKPGRFLAGGMTISNLQEILELSQGISPWRDMRLASLLMLLRSLFAITFLEGWGPEWNPLPAVGYLVFPTASLTDAIQPHIREFSGDLREIMPESIPADANAVIANVKAIEGSTWPLTRGPIIRTAGAQTAIDLHAAFYRLSEMVTIPGNGGGNLVNARAVHFENYVQAEIDRTAWAAKSPLQKFRQKTLRLNGNSITDIDAIAMHGTKLLLVSCKSVPYTAAYERGDYGTVRNVRTNAEHADRDWQEIVNKLRQNPRGDNYNFEGYELHGVVCAPFVVFVHREQTRIILSVKDRTLRAVCSVSELVDFLTIPVDG
jgi:hypothetical protein